MVDQVNPEDDFKFVNPYKNEVEEDEDSSFSKNVAAAESYPETSEGIQDKQLESAEVAQAERSEAAIQDTNYFGDIPFLSAIGRTTSIGFTDLINETDKFLGISNGLKKYYDIDVQLGKETLLATPEEMGLTPKDMWESGGATVLQFGAPFAGLPFSVTVGGATLIPKIPGFLQGAEKLTKALGILKNSPNGKIFLDGALGSIPIDYAMFSPDDPNAMNAGLDTGFFEKISFGLIANDSAAGLMLREVLAHDPNDPDWINRGRNAVIGLLAGTVASGLFSALKSAGALVRGAKEELDEVSKEYATNLVKRIEEGKVSDPDAVKELADKLPEDSLRAEDFIEPETAGEVLAKVAKEGNEYHQTPSPKRDIKNPQYKPTPQEEKALLKIATDALEGRPIDITDPKLPINLNKIETSEQIRSVIHAVGKVIHNKLDRNMPMTDYADKALSILGRINAKKVQEAAEQVDYSRGYIVASKLMTVNATQNHLKHLDIYLKNPEDVVAKFNYNMSQLEMVESVNAAANLSTAGGRFLAEFKLVSKELTKDEQATLWKADILNRMIDSGKVSLKKAKRERKLADKTAFESQAVRKGDVDPSKVRAKRKKEPKSTSRKEEIADIEKGVARKSLQIQRANEMQLQTILAYGDKSLRAKTRDVALEVFINGLLSRPTTQLINISGNASAIGTSIFERAWAGFRNTDKEGIQLKEAYYLMSGMMEAVTKDAMKIFREAYKKGPSDFSIKTDMSRPFQRALSAEAWGLSGNWGKAIDKFGAFVNFPGRVLMSADEVFKAINYRGQVNALSFRKANDDVVKKLGRLPKTDEERLLVVDNYNKFNEVGGMPSEITEQATGFARLQTFTNELTQTVKQDRNGKIFSASGISGSFKNAIEADPTGFLRFMFPFFQTPVNLIKYGAERTAIMRRVTPLMDELKSTDASVRQLAEAKVATGNILTATGLMAGWNGLATGAPPVNHKLRNAYEEAGMLPYHIWVPFLGYRPYNRLDPLGMSIANGANLAIFAKSLLDITIEGAKTKFDRDIFDAYQDAFAQLAMGSVRLITDKHYLHTMGILANALDGDAGDIKRVFGNLSPNKVLMPYSSLRAGIIKGITGTKKPFKQGDPSVIEEGDELSEIVSKEISQEWDMFWKETFDKHLPFWSDPDDFEPDIVGKPSVYPGTVSEEMHFTPSRLLNKSLTLGVNVLQQTLNPFPEAKRTDDPLKLKIAELGIEADRPKNIRSLKGVELSTEERQYWAKIYTGLNKEYSPTVKTKAFNKQSEAEQKKEIEYNLQSHHKEATMATLDKFDRINRFALADSEDKFNRQTGDVVGNDVQSLFNLQQPQGQQ